MPQSGGEGDVSQNDEKNIKVIRMSLPIMGNLNGLQESIFSLSRNPQLNVHKKKQKIGVIPKILGTIGKYMMLN